MSLLYAYYMTLDQKNKFARFDGSTARITSIPDVGLSGQSFAIEIRCRRVSGTTQAFVLTCGNTSSANNKQVYFFFSYGTSPAFAFYIRGYTSSHTMTGGAGRDVFAFQNYRLEYDAALQQQRVLVNGEVMDTKTGVLPYTSNGQMQLCGRVDAASVFPHVDIDFVKVWRNGVEVLNTGFDDNTINDKYGNTGVQEGTIQFLEE
jgi:hypothetical protein